MSRVGVELYFGVQFGAVSYKVRHTIQLVYT